MAETIVCSECKGTGRVEPFDVMADENYLREWLVSETWEPHPGMIASRPVKAFRHIDCKCDECIAGGAVDEEAKAIAFCATNEDYSYCENQVFRGRAFGYRFLGEVTVIHTCGHRVGYPFLASIPREKIDLWVAGFQDRVCSRCEEGDK